MVRGLFWGTLSFRATFVESMSLAGSVFFFQFCEVAQVVIIHKTNLARFGDKKI